MRTTPALKAAAQAKAKDDSLSSIITTLLTLYVKGELDSYLENT